MIIIHARSKNRNIVAISEKPCQEDVCIRKRSRRIMAYWWVKEEERYYRRKIIKKNFLWTPFVMEIVRISLVETF